MPKYLRTSGISAAVEELIREARERLYIISPYLKLSDQIKELLNDKEREKVEVRIIFGKQELNPTEMSFLQNLSYVRLYFSKNLHAKCYLNEKQMIITSMNLYEFSQQNNREMGILLNREIEGDKSAYEEAWKDIESILNNAMDFSYVAVSKEFGKEEKPSTPVAQPSKEAPSAKNLPFQGKLLSATAISKELGISSKELIIRIEALRWIEKQGDELVITNLGKAQGVELKKGQYGPYIAYPDTILKELE